MSSATETAESGGLLERKVGGVANGDSPADAKELTEKGADHDFQCAGIESKVTFDAESDDFKDDGGSSDVETGENDDKEKQPTLGIVLDEFLGNDANPLRWQRPRSKSLDATSDNPDKLYMYSFRMPHDSNITNKHASNASSKTADSNPVTSCFGSSGRRTRSDGAAATTDYNFVLDNYVEYADDTKIPRLRGKDVDKLLAAIHSSHPVVLCAVVTAGCFLTYSVSNHAPFLRADLSQAIVVTLVLATLPEVAASAGAGAFAGMADLDAIPNYGWLTLLALVVSVIWLLFHRYKILVGCGGRLGTCAFVSMNVTVALFGMPTGAVPWALYGDVSRLWPDRLELVPSVLAVAACTFISAVGGAVRLKSKIPLNPVQAPTTIALLCMLILEPTGFSYTGQIDAGLAVGSFVAMASDTYLSSVFEFGVAGFIAGLWMYYFSSPSSLALVGKRVSLHFVDLPHTC